MTLMEFWYFLGLIIALIGYVPFILIIVILFVKYPVRAFMKAKAIGLDPLANRTMKLLPLMDTSELAKTSDGSFVFTDPDHFFIEAKSKKPIVLLDSRLGKTVSLDGYRLMALLKEKGYDNFDDMLDENGEPKPGCLDDRQFEITKEMVKDLKEAGLEIEGRQFKINDDMLKAIEKDGKIIIKIEGESLPISDAVEFFSHSIPGQVLETMLQYRSAVENLRNKKKDLFQWIVILGFFVICVGFAVLLISHAAPPVANVVTNMADVGAKTAGTTVG